MSEAQAFVERLFEIDGLALPLRFFSPTHEPTGEFVCFWTIGWQEEPRRRSTRGIDGMQALLLAMRSAHSELAESDAYKAGRLTYLDGPDLDLPPPWGTLPQDGL